MTRLRADHVTLGYDGDPVVHDVDLAVPDGRVTVLVGANGCGKSTLLRGLARLLRPRSGEVLLDGTDIHAMRSRDIARVVGLLPQHPVAPDGVTVAELVERGRHPHRGLRRRAADGAAVRVALEATDTLDLANRPVAALSGGQRQRVWIAMTLAQETDVLLLDEPTTYLDLAHQVDMLDLVARLNVERGTTVVMVLHDLGLAARYADHLVALRGGRVHAAGTPEQVLTEQTVAAVFDLDARVLPDPVTGTPLVVPRRGRPRCADLPARPVPAGAAS